MASSSSSRKRLQPRQQPRPKTVAQPPWQPCRRCGKSYVQLPLELCNECDKKRYCAAPPQRIRLDDKRPLLGAEPLVFPASPPPYKLNWGSTRLEKRGKRETKTLPSIESVVGTPVVERQSSLKTAGTSNDQHSSDSAVRESRTNAAEGSVGEASIPQTLSSPRPSIRRKPVAAPIKKDGGPVYELPAEVVLTPLEQANRRRSMSQDNRPLLALQQAQQQQKRLPAAAAGVAVAAETSSPPTTPPRPRTYLLAQPTRNPHASFAQRVVRDAGGPLNAERQRVLEQELGRAQAELECSRRTVRNLNEELSRMGLRQFREDTRRLQEHNLSTRTMAQGGAEATDERRRRLEIGHHQQRRRQRQQPQQDLDLEVLLGKGERNPESLSRVYSQLCGRCQGAVQDFIES
ncbi:hypothetical protein PG994_010706 [Apiospora phragmitis]|uniref:Uncharacterized protein n=1 Tax=Apiospora phragmitis TaxID=2905665 RepID=A0ABR1TQR8_9PEZI